MDQFQLGVVFAGAHLAGLRRRADRRRLASRVPGPTAGQHHHEPGIVDAGHCRACARQASHWTTTGRCNQQEEATVREAHGWARAACRRASVALWSSGTALFLTVVALLSG